MPTKREMREALEQEQEQTQEISVEEIKEELEKEEKEQVQNDMNDLDVPNFTPKVKSVKKILEEDMSGYDDDEDNEFGKLKFDKPLKIMIISLIGIVMILIAIVTVDLINTDSKDVISKMDTVVTSVPETTTEPEETAPSTKLDYYYEQRVLTAIVNQLNDDYGTSGYTKPTSEQLTIDGSQQSLTVSFNLTVGDAYKKNYVMPAEFKLAWNDDEDCYDVTSYTIDDSEAVKSGFKAHTSKKEAEKTAKESANTEGSEVSNFEVTVRNSVTVTITGKGSGTVTAYAISEDGTTTELASVSNGTTTKTVSLESGQYKLVLYATENAGYSWNYQLG